jgi:hypothetical protein
MLIKRVVGKFIFIEKFIEYNNNILYIIYNLTLLEGYNLVEY